jgi:hypothetical protein
MLSSPRTPRTQTHDSPDGHLAILRRLFAQAADGQSATCNALVEAWSSLAGEAHGDRLAKVFESQGASTAE